MFKSAIQLYLFPFMLLHSISSPGKFNVQAISPHGNQSEFLQSTRSQPSMPSPFCNRQVSPPDLSWPNGQTYGLARVARLRSSDLRGQTPWSDASLRMVTELLMRDALVLCLPPEVLEMQGRPSVNLQCAQVVAVVGAAVVCTYVPSTLLEPIGSASTPPTLTVGSILGRSNQAPTHPELGAAEHKYGIHFQRATGGDFGLDARWPLRSARTGRCNGFCCTIASESFAFPARFADLLQLAATAYDRESNAWIACDHATHRSLGGALMLSHCCHLGVNLQHSSKRRNCQCGNPTTLQSLCHAARALQRVALTVSAPSRAPPAISILQREDAGAAEHDALAKRRAADGLFYTYAEFERHYGHRAGRKWALAKIPPVELLEPPTAASANAAAASIACACSSTDAPRPQLIPEPADLLDIMRRRAAEMHPWPPPAAD